MSAQRKGKSLVLIRSEIMRLKRLGHTSHSIARIMNLETHQVNYHVKQCVSAVTPRLIIDSREELEKRLHQIHELQIECLEAWEKSKRPAERTQTRTRECGDESGGVETLEESRGRDGDVRYIQEWRELHKEECELRGWYPDKELKISGTVAVGLSVWDQLSSVLPANGQLPDEVQARLNELKMIDGKDVVVNEVEVVESDDGIPLYKNGEKVQ